jgi:hypothetical protein
MKFVRFDDISFETWTSWMICHENSWKNQTYFKLKNCGIQNVLKLFWIRLLHFLFVIFNSMFFMFDNLYQFCFKQHSKIMAILICLLWRIKQLGEKFHVKHWKLISKLLFLGINSHKFSKKYILEKNGCNCTLEIYLGHNI